MAGDGASERWAAVDRYVADLLLAPDPELDAALEANAAAGLPPHDVSAMQGKLLFLLARLAGARSVLEVGTLGGYSTIWLARALPANGRLVTLEIDPAYAAVAVDNVRRAGLAERLEVRVGPALDTLGALIGEGAGPFDLIFIDADKPNNPGYLRGALELSRPGTAIVADNVVREGAVVEVDSDDPRVQGVRAFHELLAADPRIDATTIQTVGAKGYDGFTLALVTDAGDER
ncbi:MAG: O-methyltransferase [Thermoleophilaceae bacterium]